MDTKAVFYKKIRDFLQLINASNDNPNIFKLKEIPEDKNLFDLGLIDSLKVVELILFLEKEFDITPLSENVQIDPETFYTLNSIYEAFFIKK